MPGETHFVHPRLWLGRDATATPLDRAGEGVGLAETAFLG